MNKSLWTLCKLELCNLFSINRICHLQDKKERQKALWLVFAYVLLGVMFALYIGSYCFGLIYLGLQDLVPTYLIFVVSLVVLMFGLLKVGSILFQRKGYDLLCALPIKKQHIVLSRCFRLYIENLLFSLIVYVPGFLVYGILVKPNITFYLMIIAICLFSLLLPMAISMIFGTFIAYVSSKVKHKTLIEVVFTIIVVVGILMLSSYGSTMPEEIDLSQVRQLMEMVTSVIARIYPPAVFYASALLENNSIACLLLCATSCLVFGVVVGIIHHYFDTILQNLHPTSSKNDYQLSIEKERSILKTLVLKEFKRYFASSVYVTNTIIGPVLGMVFAALYGFVDFETYLGLPIDLSSIIPYIVVAMFVMMTPTSVSLSMEGKEWWIIKSLPVSAKKIVDSKLLMTFLLNLPFFIVSELSLIFALKQSFLENILMIFLSLTLLVFSIVFGFWMNTKFCRFDWQNDAEVVKQSMAALFGGMGGMLVSVCVVGILFCISPNSHLIVKLILIIGLMFMTHLIYKKCINIKFETL